MEKGTLLELGLLPIVTSAFIWQLAAGLRLVKVNFNLRSDRELFQSGQKVTAIVLSAIYSAGLIYSGYYDNIIRGYNPLADSSIPWTAYAYIFVQINIWSFIVTLIVDVFDKGFAFGSGVLGLITVQFTTNLVRGIAGLESIRLPNSNVTETFGSFPNLVKNFSLTDFSKNFNIVLHSFSRVSLPNLTQFYVSALVVFAVIFFQNFRVDLPIRSTKVRSMNNVYPIRFLYTGALPVLFTYTLLANIQFFVYLLSTVVTKLGYNSDLFKLLVVEFQSNEASKTISFKSGLFSYLLTVNWNPLKILGYTLITLSSSVWFATKWSFISGSAPKDIAQQFKDQGVSIAGKRDVSIVKELNKIIPLAAATGAIALTGLAVLSELLGGAGTGVAGVIAISSTFAILEDFLLEFQQSGAGSQFTSALGL